VLYYFRLLGCFGLICFFQSCVTNAVDSTLNPVIRLIYALPIFVVQHSWIGCTRGESKSKLLSVWTFSWFWWLNWGRGCSDNLILTSWEVYALRTSSGAFTRIQPLRMATLMSDFAWGQWPSSGRGVWRLSGWVTSYGQLPHDVARRLEILPVTSARMTNVNLRIKCPVLLSDFNQNWDLSINFSKSPQYQI
jgi:hypothetical protein